MRKMIGDRVCLIRDHRDLRADVKINEINYFNFINMIEEDIVFQEKYLIGRKLGAGSFGAILLGTDIDTGKYVAIKFVRNIIPIFSRKNHHLTSSLNCLTRLE